MAGKESGRDFKEMGEPLLEMRKEAVLGASCSKRDALFY